MRKDYLGWSAIALVGLAGLFTLPKLAGKGRKVLRRVAGMTHRSGVSNPGVRATADPARGLPA